MNAVAVFHLHFAQVMQMRAPAPILLKVLRDSFRQQDVTGVPTIHQTLGEVDANSGGVEATVNVRNLADRPAVHAHPDR